MIISMGFYKHQHSDPKRIRDGHDKAAKMSIGPLVTRAEMVVCEDLDDEMRRVRDVRGNAAQQSAARAFAAEVEEGRASYGGMLGRVWKEAKRTLDAVEADDTMPVPKRIAALSTLAKLMPLLAKAEATHKARIGGVAVEDMSDAQLDRELRHIKKKRRSTT